MKYGFIQTIRCVVTIQDKIAAVPRFAKYKLSLFTDFSMLENKVYMNMIATSYICQYRVGLSVYII